MNAFLSKANPMVILISTYGHARIQPYLLFARLRRGLHPTMDLGRIPLEQEKLDLFLHYEEV